MSEPSHDELLAQALEWLGESGMLVKCEECGRLTHVDTKHIVRVVKKLRERLVQEKDRT